MCELGDRFEFAGIMRAGGRLHDEGEPDPVEDLRALHGVLPGAAHVSEAVVTIGIERIERQRQSTRTGLGQTLRHVLGDAHAVGADDHPQAALRRALDDLEDVATQQRLAPGEDRQALRGEGGDLVDDLVALLGAQLASIGEVLGADRRPGAGVQIAVLAGEIAAVGEVPGDDVGPGEIHAITCRRSRERRRGSSRRLRALLAPARTSRCPFAPWGGRTPEYSRAWLPQRQSIGRESAR